MYIGGRVVHLKILSATMDFPMTIRAKQYTFVELVYQNALWEFNRYLVTLVLRIGMMEYQTSTAFVVSANCTPVLF